MALHSKAEFAEKCFIPTKTLAIYIGRGTVVLTKDGLINDQEPKNAKFITKRAVFALKKGQTDELPEQNKASAAPAISFKSTKSPKAATQKVTGTSFLKNEELKIQLQNEKLQEEIIKKKLDNQKMLGDFAKVDQVMLLFPIYSEALNGAWEALFDDFIKQLAVKFQLTREEITAFKAEKNNIVNRAKERAVNTAVASLKKAQQELADQKGIGQHA